MEWLFGWFVGLMFIALLALWLVLFPDTRQALWEAGTGLARGLGARGAVRLQRSGRVLRDNGRQAGDSATHMANRLGRHWKLLTALALMLIVPAVLILGLRQHVMLQGYDLAHQTNQLDQGTASLVASLLRGERLVPPPPLPPDVFVTKEVKRQRPHLDLGRANRNWNLLNATFRQRLLAVFKVMRERYGYDMVMIEGYRSPQRQTMLAGKGGNVTNAGAFQSYHQYGLAADCAFYRNGKLVISAQSQWAMRGYELYGKVAEAAGLVWGGSWTSIRDLGHVELHLPGKGPRYHHG